MEYIAKDREYVAYFPLKTRTERFNELRVSVGYSMGGMNYFSGERVARGYKVRVQPLTRTQFGFTTVMMGEQWESGVAFPVEDTNRFSAKRLGEIAKGLDAKRIAELYELREYQSIFAILPVKPSKPSEEKFFRVIHANGKITEWDVKENYTLKQLQNAVGGLVEILTMKDGSELVVNEEGKLNNLPVNIAGTKIWERSYGKTDTIVGDIIHTKGYDWNREEEDKKVAILE